MKSKKQQQKEIPKLDSYAKFRGWQVYFVDSVVRGLIAFVVLGLGMYFLLVGYFKMKVIYVFPIAFILSILVSPILSKISLGETIVTKYERWLEKTFKLKE